MATSPTKTASDGTVTPVNANEFLATNLPGNDERAKLSALGFSDSIPAWFANQTSTTLVNSSARGGERAPFAYFAVG